MVPKRQVGAASINGGSAMLFIVLLGVVSLFSDMTYEGARSINGPFLALLGANAAAVGFISGFENSSDMPCGSCPASSPTGRENTGPLP